MKPWGASGRRFATAVGLAVALPAMLAPGPGAAQAARGWDTPALGALPTPSWLSLGGELRLRVESRAGLGWREGASDSYVLLRSRLHVAVAPTRWARLFVQGQDARAPGMSGTPSGVFRDPMDLRQANLRLGDAAEGVVAVTVGRQLLSYGDQRLIGPLEWTNTARALDAAKLEVRFGWAKVDVFSGRVVLNDPSRSLNRSLGGNGLHGVYAALQPTPALVLEPFLLWRTLDAASGEGVSGDVDRFTGGLRLVGTVGGLQSTVMYAEQRGSYGAAAIAGRALSVAATWRPFGPTGTALWVEYNHASGDSNPSDGTVEWFDDLLPTAHLYYGYNDLVGLRNVHNGRVGAGFTVLGSLSVAVDVHGFWLASPNDHLYGAAGAVAVPVPVGGAEARRIGEEIDLSLSLGLSRTLSLAGGVGLMLPGPFLDSTTEGRASTFTHVALALML